MRSWVKDWREQMANFIWQLTDEHFPIGKLGTFLEVAFDDRLDEMVEQDAKAPA